mmetsp:Transcript_2674/g.7608  ORF Transcript_2674/g.7608 Transcript_2674/m.7608 type:complete len:235 (-) Transcript_2674:87-791(-)
MARRLAQACPWARRGLILKSAHWSPPARLPMRLSLEQAEARHHLSLCRLLPLLPAPVTSARAAPWAPASPWANRHAARTPQSLQTRSAPPVVVSVRAPALAPNRRPASPPRPSARASRWAPACPSVRSAPLQTQTTSPDTRRSPQQPPARPRPRHQHLVLPCEASIEPLPPSALVDLRTHLSRPLEPLRSGRASPWAPACPSAWPAPAANLRGPSVMPWCCPWRCRWRWPERQQ